MVIRQTRNTPESAHPIDYVGGALILDFTNVGTHAGHEHEHMRSYSDLINFVRDAGSLSPAEARRLSAEAARHPNTARSVLDRAIALREASMRAFSAFARGRIPEAGDLELIGSEATAALAHRRIGRTGSQFNWAWSDEPTLERVLWPIAQSGADLLTSDEDRRLLRECASDTCEWLFLDRTRNHSRRWCDMADCGNRAKQERFRARALRRSRRST